EVLRRTVEGKTPVEHRPGLGNTGIVFAALKAGSIDLYPEYTGTIAREILKVNGNPGIGDLNAALAPQGLGVAVRLGFNNTYALAMRGDRAEALRGRRAADVARHPRPKQRRLSTSKAHRSARPGGISLARCSVRISCGSRASTCCSCSCRSPRASCSASRSASRRRSCRRRSRRFSERWA